MLPQRSFLSSPSSRGGGGTAQQRSNNNINNTNATTHSNSMSIGPTSSPSQMDQQQRIGTNAGIPTYAPQYINDREERERMSRWIRTTVRTDDDAAGLAIFSGKAKDALSDSNAVATYTSTDSRVKSKVFEGLNVRTKDSPQPRKGYTEEELEKQYEALACVWKRIEPDAPPQCNNTNSNMNTTKTNNNNSNRTTTFNMSSGGAFNNTINNSTINNNASSLTASGARGRAQTPTSQSTRFNLRPLSRAALTPSPTALPRGGKAMTPQQQMQQRPLSSALKSTVGGGGSTRASSLGGGAGNRLASLHTTGNDSNTTSPSNNKMTTASSAYYANAPEPTPLQREDVDRPVEETVCRLQQEAMFGGGGGGGSSIDAPFAKSYDSERKRELARQAMRDRWVVKKETAPGHAPILIEDTPMMGGLQRSWATVDVQLAPFRGAVAASGAPPAMRQTQQEKQRRAKAAAARREEMLLAGGASSSSDDEGSYYTTRGGVRKKKVKTNRQTASIVRELDRFEAFHQETMLPAHFVALPNPEEEDVGGGGGGNNTDGGGEQQSGGSNAPAGASGRPGSSSRRGGGGGRVGSANNKNRSRSPYHNNTNNNSAAATMVTSAAVKITPTIVAFDESSDEEYFLAHQQVRDAIVLEHVENQFGGPTGGGLNSLAATAMLQNSIIGRRPVTSSGAPIGGSAGGATAPPHSINSSHHQQQQTYQKLSYSERNRTKFVVEKRAKDSVEKFNAMIMGGGGGADTPSASMNRRLSAMGASGVGGLRGRSPSTLLSGSTVVTGGGPKGASFAPLPTDGAPNDGAANGGISPKSRKNVGFQSAHDLSKHKSGTFSTDANSIGATAAVPPPVDNGPQFYAADAVDILRELYRSACPFHQDREDAYVQSLGGLSFPITYRKFKELLRRLVENATGGNAIVLPGGSFRKPVASSAVDVYMHSAAIENNLVTTPEDDDDLMPNDSIAAAVAGMAMGGGGPIPNGSMGRAPHGFSGGGYYSNKDRDKIKLNIPDDVFRAMYAHLVEKAQSLPSAPAVTAVGSSHNARQQNAGLPIQLTPVLPYVSYLHGVAQCFLSPRQLQFTYDVYHNIRNSPHINYYLYHLRHRVLIKAQRRLSRQLRLLQRIRAMEAVLVDNARGGSFSAPSGGGFGGSSFATSAAQNGFSSSMLGGVGGGLGTNGAGGLSALTSGVGGAAGGSVNPMTGAMGLSERDKRRLDNRTVDELRKELLNVTTEPQRLLTLSAGLEYGMLGDPIEEGAKSRLWYQRRNPLHDPDHHRRSVVGGPTMMPPPPPPMSALLMTSGKNQRLKTEEEILDETLRDIERRLELIQSSAADTFKTNTSQGNRAGEIKDQLLLSIFLPKKIKPEDLGANGRRKGGGGGGGGAKKGHSESAKGQTLARRFNPDTRDGGEDFDYDEEADADLSTDYSDSDDDDGSSNGGDNDGGLRASRRARRAAAAAAAEKLNNNRYEPTKFATFVVRDVVFNLRNVSIQFPHPEEDAFVNTLVQLLASTSLDTATSLISDEAAARRKREEDVINKAKLANIQHASIASMTGDIDTCAMSETAAQRQIHQQSLVVKQGGGGGGGGMGSSSAGGSGAGRGGGDANNGASSAAASSEYRPPLHPPPLSYLSLDDFRMLIFCDDRAMGALESVCPAEKTVVDGVFAQYC